MSNITVEQAKNLTNQEFFNRVWERAKDHRKANNGEHGVENCLYRAPNGLECFIGINIPDSKYTPNMEGLKDTPGHYSIDDWFPVIFPNVNEVFARSCQRVHDSHSCVSWSDYLKDIAERYNLTVPD